MTTWEIGDLVTPNKPIKGLRKGHIYRIKDIHRSLDGAYDWDSIFLDGIPVVRHKDRIQGQFCEFDFKQADI